MHNINTFEITLQKGQGTPGTWVSRFYYEDLLRWTWADTEDFYNDFEKYGGSLGITISDEVRQIVYNKCDGYVTVSSLFQLKGANFSLDMVVTLPI